MDDIGCVVCPYSKIIHMYKLMKKRPTKKKKSKVNFLKLTTNDRSDKELSGLICLLQGYIHAYNYDRTCIKSQLKMIFMKLIKNGLKDQGFLLQSLLLCLECFLPLPRGLHACMKS